MLILFCFLFLSFFFLLLFICFLSTFFLVKEKKVLFGSIPAIGHRYVCFDWLIKAGIATLLLQRLLFLGHNDYFLVVYRTHVNQPRSLYPSSLLNGPSLACINMNKQGYFNTIGYFGVPDLYSIRNQCMIPI